MILSIFGEYFYILNLYDLYISFQNSNCWQISILYDENIQITSHEYFNNNDIDESLCVLKTSTQLATAGAPPIRCLVIGSFYGQSVYRLS